MGIKGKEAIDQKIDSKPVFIISKSYCPFCVKAKQVLKKYNIPAENIEIMEIENDKDCNEIQDYMRHIGGGDETQAAYRSSKLQGMLESAGAL